MRKRKSPTKKLISLVVIIVFLFLIKYVEAEMIKNFDSEIEKSSSSLIVEELKVESANNDLNNTNKNLQENISTLNELKSGDEYHLHDPTYDEVIDFLNSYSSSSEKQMVEKAKSKGLQCAYVMAYVGGISIAEADGGDTFSLGGGMYPLIGFDTVDRGMMYYEVDTEYQVIPVVGRDYTDCVVGDPYLPGIFDNITDLLEIW